MGLTRGLFLELLAVGDAGEGDLGAGEGFHRVGQEAQGQAVATELLIDVVEHLRQALAPLVREARQDAMLTPTVVVVPMATD